MEITFPHQEMVNNVCVCGGGGDRTMSCSITFLIEKCKTKLVQIMSFIIIIKLDKKEEKSKKS